MASLSGEQAQKPWPASSTQTGKKEESSLQKVLISGLGKDLISQEKKEMIKDFGGHARRLKRLNLKKLLLTNDEAIWMLERIIAVCDWNAFKPVLKNQWVI